MGKLNKIRSTTEFYGPEKFKLDDATFLFQKRGRHGILHAE